MKRSSFREKSKAPCNDPQQRDGLLRSAFAASGHEALARAINAALKIFCAVTLAAAAASANALEIHGHFSAVTETELLIDLVVREKSRAELTMEVNPADDVERGWKEFLPGS